MIALTVRSRDRSTGTDAGWTQFLPDLPPGPYSVYVCFETGNVGGVAQLQMKCDMLTRCLTTNPNAGGWFPVVSFQTSRVDPAEGTFFLSDAPKYMEFRFLAENTNTIYVPPSEERLIPMVLTHLSTGQKFKC